MHETHRFLNRRLLLRTLLLFLCNLISTDGEGEGKEEGEDEDEDEDEDEGEGGDKAYRLATYS